MLFMGRNLILLFVRVNCCDDLFVLLYLFCAVRFLCVFICNLMAVTTLRVHPAETRLTVYRRPYIVTFSLVALDPDNRLRYPLASLFFMMFSCLQIARLLQEKNV